QACRPRSTLRLIALCTVRLFRVPRSSRAFRRRRKCARIHRKRERFPQRSSVKAKADGGELIARVMRENRVKYCFAINGGHLFPILGQSPHPDIKLIHMRHEQATAYAADAYARTSGEVGVCMVTAGCGLTNAVTGLCVAGLTNSAVVCISGQHPNTEDHLGSFQEAYG